MAIGRRPLIDELLRKRVLIAPFKDALATQRAYGLVVDPAARRRSAVRAFERWLLEQASAEQASAASAPSRVPPRPRSRRASA